MEQGIDQVAEMVFVRMYLGIKKDLTKTNKLEKGTKQTPVAAGATIELSFPDKRIGADGGGASFKTPQLAWCPSSRRA